MSSQSHARHLDENYRYQRHIYDLTREYYLLGRSRLIANLDATADASVLEIGCGTALNLIRIHQRYPRAKLYGIDLSQMMLETADAALKRRQLNEKIVLALGDATDFDANALLGRNRFDRIFFSYSLSMIPPWKAALDHAAAHLVDGGSLHIVDFGDCRELAKPLKKALYAWLNQFRVTPRQALQQSLTDSVRTTQPGTPLRKVVSQLQLSRRPATGMSRAVRPLSGSGQADK
ncbi:MAG: class I SAM-dependent methyltransferase [Hyphomicrobiaceae bacterium]